MKIKKALHKAIDLLKNKKIASAELDAEVLLSYVLRKPREYVLIHHDDEIKGKLYERYDILIKKRAKLEPVAYLTGHKEFYGMDFFVDRRVLIPRPETEQLVDYALKTMPLDSNMAVADIGTGSGCIAITIAKFRPKAAITAIDISQDALRLAKKNARLHNVCEHIRFIRGSLLKPIKRKTDLIIANLPYLTSREIDGNLKHEPNNALCGKKDGLEYITGLLKTAPGKINAGGKIIMEINPLTVGKLKFFLKNYYSSAQIKFLKDLSGRIRILEIQM